MMRGIISLCPTSANFMDENSLPSLQNYSIPTPAFSNVKLSLLNTCWKEKQTKKGDYYPFLRLRLHAYLQKLKEAFFEIQRIAVIACPCQYQQLSVNGISAQCG